MDEQTDIRQGVARTSAPPLILKVPLPSKKQERLMVVHRALLAALVFKAASRAWMLS